MNCKKCGKPLSEGEKFCLACGTRAEGEVIREDIAAADSTVSFSDDQPTIKYESPESGSTEPESVLPKYSTSPEPPQYSQPQYGQQYPQQQNYQPQYGQPPSGQPQYGQPQYGQQQYPQPTNTPPYTQPQYVQQVFVSQQAHTSPEQTPTDAIARIISILLVLLFGAVPFIPLFSIGRDDWKISLYDIATGVRYMGSILNLHLDDAVDGEGSPFGIIFMIVAVIAFLALYISLLITLCFVAYSTPRGGKNYWSLISSDSMYFLIYSLYILYLIYNINSITRRWSFNSYEIIKVNPFYYIIVAAALTLAILGNIKYRAYKHVIRQEKQAFKAYQAYRSSVPPYNNNNGYNNNNNGYNNNYNGYNNYNNPMP